MTTRTLPAVPAPASISPELLKQHSLTSGEYARIEAALGRTPSLTELGIYSVMWSEHCSYKSSRVHLKRLPTRGERTSGPGSASEWKYGASALVCSSRRAQCMPFTSTLWSIGSVR